MLTTVQMCANCELLLAIMRDTALTCYPLRIHISATKYDRDARPLCRFLLCKHVFYRYRGNMDVIVRHRYEVVR